MTKLVLFNRLRLDTDNPNLTISINSTIIFPSNSVKFLRLNLDSKFNFDDHFKYLADKSIKVLNIVKVLRGVWWGANLDILFKVFQSLIRSLYEYGSHTYTFQRHKYFDKLKKIRNHAFKLALGYRRSTPINVMLAETCEPLLWKRFFYLAKIYLIKTY